MNCPQFPSWTTEDVDVQLGGSVVRWLGGSVAQWWCSGLGGATVAKKPVRAHCNRKFYREYNAPRFWPFVLFGILLVIPPPGGRRRLRRTVELLNVTDAAASWLCSLQSGFSTRRRWRTGVWQGFECWMAFVFNSIHPSILAAAGTSSSQLDLLILTICICVS